MLGNEARSTRFIRKRLPEDCLSFSKEVISNTFYMRSSFRVKSFKQTSPDDLPADTPHIACKGPSSTVLTKHAAWLLSTSPPPFPSRLDPGAVSLPSPLEKFLLDTGFRTLEDQRACTSKAKQGELLRAKRTMSCLPQKSNSCYILILPLKDSLHFWTRFQVIF